MKAYTAAPAHEDERGTITDLAAEPDCADAITVVRTAAGAVRGNHYHDKTTQWTYVVSGRMFMTDGVCEVEATPGTWIKDDPGSPHAWRAIDDTVCVVWVKGPRAGNNYEADTTRLETPLIA